MSVALPVLLGLPRLSVSHTAEALNSALYVSVDDLHIVLEITDNTCKSPLSVTGLQYD